MSGMDAKLSEALQAQIARFRESGILGRSHGLSRLFDYLADADRKGHGLRETDVAQDVFARDLTVSGDASVRVYVHRLRRKLDDFYAGQGADQAHRLVIPLGEYRLDVVETMVVQTRIPPPSRNRRLWP